MHSCPRGKLHPRKKRCSMRREAACSSRERLHPRKVTMHDAEGGFMRCCAHGLHRGGKLIDVLSSGLDTTYTAHKYK